MRIFDEQGQELDLENIDLSLGYLKNEKLFLQHSPRITHYKVNCFIFDDNSHYYPVDENDSHIKVINAEKGQFDYIPDKDETRVLKGAAIGLVVDKEAEDIYEDIQRYILYREDELELRELPSRMNNAEDSIVETQENLEEANLNIEDLILLMAEILGGEEEIPEEEQEEEIEISESPEEENLESEEYQLPDTELAPKLEEEENSELNNEIDLQPEEEPSNNNEEEITESSNNEEEPII